MGLDLAFSVAPTPRVYASASSSVTFSASCQATRSLASPQTVANGLVRSAVAAAGVSAVAVRGGQSRAAKKRSLRAAPVGISEVKSDAYWWQKEAGASEKQLFKIVEVSGCGFGMQAEQDIKAMSVIVDEMPLYTEPAGYATDLALQKFARLPTEDRDALLALAATPVDPSVEIGYSGNDLTFIRVKSVNAVAYAGGRGVYKTTCRANHSCEPNACFSIQNDGRMRYYALRDIQAGEEITASYLGEGDLLRPAGRRNKLLAHWGFRCRCPRCQGADDTCGFTCHACKSGSIYPDLRTGDWSACSECGATHEQESEALHNADQHWHQEAGKALNDKTPIGPALVGAMYNGLVSNSLQGEVPLPSLDGHWIASSLAARTMDSLIHSGDEGIAAVAAARARRRFAQKVLGGAVSRASAECLGVEAAVAEMSGDYENAMQLYDQAILESSILPRNADGTFDELRRRRDALRSFRFFNGAF